MHRSRFWIVALLAAVTVSLTAAPGQQPATSAAAPANPKLDQYKRDVALGSRRHARGHPAHERYGLQLRRARLPGVRDVEIPDRHPREERLHRAGEPAPAFRRRGWRAGDPASRSSRWAPTSTAFRRRRRSRASRSTSRSSRARPGTARATTRACRCRSPRRSRVKKIMEQQHLPGTLKLWPGVAEELLGTKAYYVRAGAFKDVDVALFAHVGANMHGELGRQHAATASSRSNTASRARARTPPARRGAAARRSTPWS